MRKQPPDSLDDYHGRIAVMHRDLGIPVDYAHRRGLTLEPECAHPVDAGRDIFGRPLLMEAEAYAAWRAMREEALSDGIELQVVSAYRSAQYQKDLFLKKLAAGRSLDALLRVNAPPGYSEHHSGQALDLHCPDVECLSEDFEHTAAFAWLTGHAGDFGFHLSFPRNNRAGYLYEPWHWRFRSG